MFSPPPLFQVVLYCGESADTVALCRVPTVGDEILRDGERLRVMRVQLLATPTHVGPVAYVDALLV